LNLCVCMSLWCPAWPTRLSIKWWLYSTGKVLTFSLLKRNSSLFCLVNSNICKKCSSRSDKWVWPVPHFVCPLRILIGSECAYTSPNIKSKRYYCVFIIIYLYLIRVDPTCVQ
jgi:hypothetical protein